MISLAKLGLVIVLLVVVVVANVAAGAVEKSTATTTKGEASTLADNKHIEEYEIKIYKRLIPADVLRDFPGMCFASTRCATVEPGKTWELTPFCGRSTCVQHEEDPSRLLELVEDCGPLPLANDKCKLDTDKTNKTAAFPYCCPIFTCEPGVVLEYPEITVANKPADAAANDSKNNNNKN